MPHTTLAHTEPLIGIQQTLDLAKLALREQLPMHAAIALGRLAREASQASEDISDCAIDRFAAEVSGEEVPSTPDGALVNLGEVS